MLRVRTLTPSLLLLLVLSAPVLADNESAAAGITADEMREHVGYLAADELEGRGTGTEGERQAAAYMIQRFKELGLVGGMPDGSFLQPFEVQGPTRLEAASCDFTVAGQWERKLELNRDMSPMGMTGQGEVQGDVVFVGYGIKTEGYDDYADVDVEGKVALILRHEFPGPQTPSAFFTTKVQRAQEAGAAAILIANDPRTHGATRQEDRLAGFGRARGPAAKVPVFHVTCDFARSLIRLAGRDLDALQQVLDEQRQPVSFPVAARVGLAVKATRTVLKANNVIAKLPGSDETLKDEYVVVGGHYDHLGLGFQGGSLGGAAARGQIHNGADDNASGIAGVMEVAEACSQTRPRRSMLFMGFSGEELGLLGSAHFVRNPTVPLEQIVTMLNMDMIGRLKEKPLEVGGVGTSPGFTGLVQAATRQEGMEVKLSQAGSGPSDHASFYRGGIPVLFFFTGLHGEYHRPEDDAHLIDYDGVQRVARAAFRVASTIANGDDRPPFVKTQGSFRPGGRGGGVRLGINIDQGFGGAGVKISQVSPDSAASKGGAQVDDVIVRLGEQEVKNLNDLRRALRALKPGSEAKCVVKRGAETLTLELKWPK